MFRCTVKKRPILQNKQRTPLSLRKQQGVRRVFWDCRYRRARQMTNVAFYGATVHPDLCPSVSMGLLYIYPRFLAPAIPRPRYIDL